MLGLVIKDLTKLRRLGYHFLENEEGDFMQIKRHDEIICEFSITPNGKVEAQDFEGNNKGEYESIECFLDGMQLLRIKCIP